MNEPPLRVLFLTPYYKPYLGGIERVIERLSAGMRRRADVAAVGVLTTHFEFPRHWMEGLPARERMDGGVEIIRLPAWPRVAPPYFSVPLVWFPPRAIGAAIRAFRPNVLHWVGDGWFWGHYFSARSAPPGTAVIFSPSFHTLTRDKFWLQPVNIALCRRADRVTALSPLERRAVHRTYHVPARKQVVVPWGVDPDDAPPEPRPAGAPLTVLCVGRLGEHKNQQFLIEAFAAAQPRLQRPARLVLVGRDEGGQQAIERQVRDLGLADKVLITGELTDAEVRAWYHRADLFALFSHYEAFGLVFFEAMVAGVPVLTHRVGANAQLLREGATVCPEHDRAAATESLVRLLNDDAERQQLGAQARRYATTFTWPPVLERFVGLYREALAEREATGNRE
ncbi:MAG TPA: glycosyltransferase family 4 protein [Dehalococcoidia bacterium]|nr:glycosyltransferase family 4 protein [Dehalococcoidia bacterium]